MTADPDAIERYARDGIHAVREAWCVGTGGKFFSYGWDDRPEHMKDLDRAFASSVAAMAAADEHARLSAEIKEHMAGFLSHYGNNTGASLQIVRDGFEGIRQILDREGASRG